MKLNKKNEFIDFINENVSFKPNYKDIKDNIYEKRYIRKSKKEYLKVINIVLYIGILCIFSITMISFFKQVNCATYEDKGINMLGEHNIYIVDLQCKGE